MKTLRSSETSGLIIGGHCVNILEGLNLVQNIWSSVLCIADILVVQFEDSVPDTRVHQWTLISQSNVYWTVHHYNS